MKKIAMTMSALLAAGTLYAADVQTEGNRVTIRPDGGQAKVVCLEVMNDKIIRVRATSEETLPQKPASLMIVPQKAPAKGSYTIEETADKVIVKADDVRAEVSKQTGAVAFYDEDGHLLLQEAKDGKQFKRFTVPEREYGLKGGPAITEAMKHGLTW
jgi:alpha-D-xyloside xylohydrolase